MERKNVANSVSGFVSSFQLHISLLFFFDKFLVVPKKKSCRRSFGSSFAWNTNSFCKQFLIQQSKLSKQTETTQTKIILGGIRTRDLWIRSPARYPLRYADLWKEWVLIGKSEWYRDEGTLHLLFFFILNNSDRQNQDSISFFVPAVFGEKIVSCSCESCCFVGLRATNFISGFVMSKFPASVLESSCVLFTLEF